MTSLIRKCLVVAVCCLAIDQVQAQVKVQPSTPVMPTQNERLSPRPIRNIPLQPIRPGQQVMPQQRNYAWYVNRMQKQGGIQAATTVVQKPMVIANPAQMPASRSFDWYRQRITKNNPHLQLPSTGGSSMSANKVMPAQRSYEWYQQQLNNARQRTHLSPLPGNRD